MPPSPAMRCSPGRELKGDNHRRGRSLEGGILLREQDDDLALFNEMQMKERENFLLQSNDDFEDIFSTKLRYFSDSKLGISIPARGKSSDLLNADNEKNDYDWLLTPPDTPLFPSLDEEPPPVAPAQRGRPRSQPITISTSSTMEKSRRNSRGSASPNRLSQSPHSWGNTFQSRERASSAPHASPIPGLRHATPSRRPSPPPTKSSSPVPRSSMPTPRRTSMGSGGTVSSSGTRGASPMKTSRGNSASPKIRAWQTNIPGFSLDAPPNLRTSLSDRPASYVRGSSPASRNGKDVSFRSGRQSMSPTASRSVSSSHSHDQEPCSSHSKGSIPSSGDNDVDSLQSIPISSSGHSSSSRVSIFPHNRSPALSKKPTRKLLASSAPKRSFDTALRQMDHQKGPRTMFRPLLSNAPSSSFYVGKVSAPCAMISRNSAVTTSGNASSDQGTSGSHDVASSGSSNQNLGGFAGEYGKVANPKVPEDLFTLDEGEAINEDIIEEVNDGSPNVQHHHFSVHGSAGSESECFHELGNPGSDISGSDNVDNRTTSLANTATSEVSEGKDMFSEFDGAEDVLLCSKCSCKYCATELTEGDLKLCPDCRRADELLTGITMVPNVVATEDPSSLYAEILDKSVSPGAPELLEVIPEFSEVTMAKARYVQLEENAMDERASSAEASLNLSLENSLGMPQAEKEERRFAKEQAMEQPAVGYDPSGSDSGCQQLQHPNNSLNTEVDVSEGAGISILLKRSSSSKWPVVQGRNFTATRISYDGPSYARDSLIDMQSSLSLACASTSSSVDLGSARQAETRMQRQLSGRKSDIENYRHDISTKHKRTGSSLSGSSSHAFQCLGHSTSTHEEIPEAAVVRVENQVLDGARVAPRGELLAESTGVDDTCTEIECNSLSGKMIASKSELSTHKLDIHLDDGTVLLSSSADNSSYGNCEDSQNDVRSISDGEVLATTAELHTLEEDSMLNTALDRVDIADVSTQNSINTVSQIEVENGHLSLACADSDVGSPSSKNTIDDVPESLVPAGSEKDKTASVMEPNILDHKCGTPEGESTIMYEGHGGTKASNLTLDEATDAILFCSSIVHNLACEAATIAIEKENPVQLEGSRLTVALLGNSNPFRKDPHGRTLCRRTSKSQKKPRQWQVESNLKSFPGNADSDEKMDASDMRIVGGFNKADSMKPPKLESKCNCIIM